MVGNWKTNMGAQCAMDVLSTTRGLNDIRGASHAQMGAFAAQQLYRGVRLSRHSLRRETSCGEAHEGKHDYCSLC